MHGGGSRIYLWEEALTPVFAKLTQKSFLIIHRYLTVHLFVFFQAFHVDGPTLCSWTKADFIKADPRHGVDICENFQALLGSGTSAL